METFDIEFDTCKYCRREIVRIGDSGWYHIEERSGKKRVGRQACRRTSATPTDSVAEQVVKNLNGQPADLEL